MNGSPEETTAKLQIPSDYIEQSIQSLPAFLAKNAPKAMKVLGTNVSDDLECVEMGDGNLNLVFIVTNKVNQYKIIVKQALPYVRCVGEGWPLTLERAQFEFQALCEEKKACPEFLPNLYYFSRSHALMVMEYIAPPNIILRKGLVQGIRYPSVASDLGKFCAKTLFKTSGFKLSETELRKNVSEPNCLDVLAAGVRLTLTSVARPTGSVLGEKLGNVRLDRTSGLYRALYPNTKQ